MCIAIIQLSRGEGREPSIQFSPATFSSLSCQILRTKFDYNWPSGFGKEQNMKTLQTIMMTDKT
jgi:hypothetical protein